MKNRTIKFRAWDKKKEVMFEPSSISWKNGVLWVCDSHGENKLEYKLINPNSELMQFTGLLDKNGKEIYEGDIGFFFKNANFIIDWDDEYGKYMYCYRKGKGAGGFSGTTAKRFQVIGNIYENPELLPPPPSA